MPQSKQEAVRPLPLRAQSVKTPRLDPYMRLLSRFYECLVLLKVLGPTRGEIMSLPVTHDERGIMRRFLKHLAYMCDFRKGGTTCTAISLEETEDKYLFWVASNEKSVKAENFLKNCLSGLSNMLQDTRGSGEMKSAFSVYDCIAFASPRIREEIRCMVQSVNETLKFLENTHAIQSQGMSNILFFLVVLPGT